MKRAVIVHCWGGEPEYCWYPWVKQRLEQQGFEVAVPAMPDTHHPDLTAWLPALKDIIGEPDEKLYLIGHSAGCVTIMRYLEQLPPEQKVAGVVFVAGFTDDLGIAELHSFYQTPINYKLIRSHLRNKPTLIDSDNDPWVPTKYGPELAKLLDGELISLHAKGHFSGPLNKPGSCTELPEIIAAIHKMSAKSA